jgi:hypothetical protein
VIVKILFAIMLLSSAVLLFTAVAVVVRVWWYIKARRARSAQLLDPDAMPESPETQP